MEGPEARLRALTEHANSVQVDLAVNPKLYFRSGVQMDITAGIYYEEGNLTAALILYMKYIVLFVERLPTHPQYKSPELAEYRRGTKSKLKTVVFPRAEELKSKLRKKYADEYDEWKAAEDARLLREAEEQQRIEEEERQADRARQMRVAAIEQERQLAVEKQQYELARQHEDELERHRVMEDERLRSLELERLESLRRLEAERLRREEERQQALAAAAVSQSVIEPPSYSSIALSPTAPPLSSLQSLGETSDSAAAANVIGGVRPAIDRSKKPKTEPSSAPVDDVSPPSSVAPNGYRWLRVPADIPQKFLRFAADSTQHNLEFCGILCGSLQRNVFSITHVIIPKQTSTADSCNMLNEEDLFDVQDQNALITLGWIHTHPTQTSFLSSVDLHTQFSYQVMMDEAVAIVCAPRYEETGLFSLTGQGMKDIRQCRQKGFHPHAKQPPLFEDCVHTLVQSDLQSTFIDLRR